MMEVLHSAFLKTVENSWAILLQSAPYILFGLLAAGLVKAMLPEDKVLKHLGGNSTAAVVKASLFGIPLPLCSCGVLPVVMGLRKQGAGKGPSMAFLVSVPETGVDSIAISYALLGPVMAVLRPLAAFITATVTGMVVSRLPESAKGESAAGTLRQNGASKNLPLNPTEPSPSWERRMVQGLKYGFFDLLGELGGWLFLGIFLSGVIAAALPQDVSRFLFAHQSWSLGLMLLLGIPVYMCASASTPIAAALILKGLSPGAALVFLLAGPATNTATLTVVSRFWGKRVTGVYLLCVASCSLLMGWLTNILFDFLHIPVGAAFAAGESSGGFLEPASAGILAALSLISFAFGKMRAHSADPDPHRGLSSCGCPSLPGT